jgi:hypothetical protein
MFEEVLSPGAIGAIEALGPHLKAFYLAGGTGLALQLGHRRSDDLDFFSERPFNTEALLSLITPERIFFTTFGTIHCETRKTKVSLFYYDVLPIYPLLSWRGMRVARWEDIAAEKIKTISQRGSKKDFVDLYAVLKTKCSIPDVCRFFRQRFEGSGINFYHVVKSLVFFEDAEDEPDPVILLFGKDWEWQHIKSFFIEGITSFESSLL